MDIEASELTVNMYASIDEGLTTIWRDLECHCDHFPFQSHDWLNNWQNSIGKENGIRPCVVVVSNATESVALFPFGRRRVCGVWVLEFLGGGQSDYNAPIVRREYADSKMCKTIWDRVQCSLPPHDVRIFSRIPQKLNDYRNPGMDMWALCPSGMAYTTDLPGTWEAMMSMVPRRISSDSRRQEKRLSSLGRLQFIRPSTDDEYERSINTLFGQKRRRYRETGVRDALSDPCVRRFYRDLRGHLSDGTTVHLSVLKLDDTILATHWGLVCRDRFYWLMPAFEGGKWAAFSCGRLLQEKCMQWAISNSMKVFDFTIGGEPYKKIWCNQENTLYESACAKTPLGVLYNLARKVMVWIKTNPRSRQIISKYLIWVRKYLRPRDVVDAPSKR